MRDSWLLALVAIWTLSGCEGRVQYCDRLAEIAADPSVEHYLLTWVDENIGDDLDPDIELHGAGGRWPGHMYIDTDFEWSRLKITENGQVRLIGPFSRREGEIFESVTSVFFGDRSRKGIVVKAQSNGDFGVQSEFLLPISSRIAVVCRD